MASNDESDSNEISGTQFVDQSGDEEVLWAVQEITAERGNKYRVKWEGVDPATGKPWAQSWVAKHDCTNDLVIEWKAKKKLAAAKKNGRQASTVSRTSGTSKRAGSSKSGTKTRRSTSEATSSRLGTVEQRPSPPPKRSTTKRKRSSEAPTATLGGAGQVDEQIESSRPRKKQKMVSLPPISSDDDEDVPPVPRSSGKATLQNNVPLKSNSTLLAVPDDDDNSPPKDPGVREVISHSNTTTELVSRRKEREPDVLSAESEEDLRPPKSKARSTSRRKSPPEQSNNVFEKAVEPMVSTAKFGPPRGAKRPEKSKTSGQLGKPGSSRAKHKADEKCVPREESPEHPDRGASFFGSPSLPLEVEVDNSTSIAPPNHISILRAARMDPPHSPVLSPRAKARLELFDKLMADLARDNAGTPPDASKHVPDDAHFTFNDSRTPIDATDPPRPLSPPPPPSKLNYSKLGISNGLVVPETESSGNSQSQPYPLPEPPLLQSSPARGPPPRRPVDLPTIAVIAPSMTPSSASPQDLPKKLPTVTSRPPKSSSFKIIPKTFRATANANSRVADPEAPPSSIESFTSPRRVDKGKQRAVGDDQLQSSLSEGEGDGERQMRQMRKKITDSALRRRGKELFDQAQRAREAQWQKNRKTKRLKPVSEIVSGAISSLAEESPLPVAGGTGNTPEMRWEDVIDFSGCANSTTLDTPENSEPKPLSKEQRERLRIELRQEEEESTQEAMGICPPPPVKVPEVMTGRDDQMPPPKSPKNLSCSGHAEDVDHVEQRSADIRLASVIVQASQEPQHEDTETEPLLVDQPTSSPPCPIPENLIDTPKRRLGEALSLLNVKSEEIQRIERELADERKNLERVKAEFAQLQQSSEPTGPVRAAWDAERAQWNQERTMWENERSTWETQRKEMSEEKATLSTRVTELLDAAMRTEAAQLRVLELEAERETWTKERDTLMNDVTGRSEELAVLTKARGEYVQDQSKWEAEKSSWVEERARWETERAELHQKQEDLTRSVEELTASIESTRASKISAENDRDFFRQQYVQASEFVDSVRKENVELEKRVEIAEGQAREGVAAIKALFEGRVKALHADVERWKGLAQLLQEKDNRTNDELRLRAAQAPELEERCSRLDIQNKSLEADVSKLGRAQQRSVYQRNRLFYEILLLKKERASLKSKLSKLAKSVDNNIQEVDTPQSAPAGPILDPENIDPNDIEILPDSMSQSLDSTFDEPSLFPCMWRPQWRDQCQQIFDAKEDLERHLNDHYRDLMAQ